MRYVLKHGLTLLLCLSFALAAHSQPSPSSTIVLPSGTQLSLAIIRPVWSASAKPGDPLYAQTTFPVAVGNTLAVPSGSYVAGQIDAITRPTRKSNRAVLNIRLTQIILANGYTIPLPEGSASATLQIQASTANDLLLDNGAQFEAPLSAALTLDATRAAAALSLSKPIKPGQFTSATMCRPTPAVEGTPDTFVPGTPGIPGTPPTVIPGVDGAPPTVIPGIPATPGTPSSTIPGSPGSPGYSCPAPPLVLSSKALPSSLPTASAVATAVPTTPNHP
jgi:hypothetical protein